MLKNIYIDLKINSFRSGLILMCYRLLNHVYLHHKSFLGNFLLKIMNMTWELLKIMLNINCQISYKAKLGHNLRLPHIAEGVIISPKANVGNYCTIFHQVTIGVNESLSEEEQIIIIEDGCYVSAGAKIISCKLGENVRVGPNAVVYKDVKKNSLVVNNSFIKNNGNVE